MRSAGCDFDERAPWFVDVSDELVEDEPETEPFDVEDATGGATGSAIDEEEDLETAAEEMIDAKMSLLEVNARKEAGCYWSCLRSCVLESCVA